MMFEALCSTLVVGVARSGCRCYCYYSNDDGDDYRNGHNDISNPAVSSHHT